MRNHINGTVALSATVPLFYEQPINKCTIKDIRTLNPYMMKSFNHGCYMKQLPTLVCLTDMSLLMKPQIRILFGTEH